LRFCGVGVIGMGLLFGNAREGRGKCFLVMWGFGVFSGYIEVVFSGFVSILVYWGGVVVGS